MNTMKKIVVSLLGFLLFAPMAFAAPLGSVQETIGAGRTLSVGLNPSSTGKWFVIANNNPSVASATISGSTLLVKGLAAGTNSIAVCTETSGVNCLNVTVTVTGSVLGVSTSAHPVGSWVILDKTVFYVHSSGLIPITTWAIFLSNGGKSSLIVQATMDDLNLPMLPLMEPKDSRVQ